MVVPAWPRPAKTVASTAGLRAVSRDGAGPQGPAGHV